MFGEYLRRIRIARDKTQAQVAEHLHISSQSISKWENNLALPTIDVLPKLASYFECPIDVFFSEYELIIFERFNTNAPSKDDIIRTLASLLPKSKIEKGDFDHTTIETTIPSESLFLPAVYDIVKEEDFITCGRLQFKLRIGYGIAARIIEALENIGIVAFRRDIKAYEVFKDKIGLLLPYIT